MALDDTAVTGNEGIVAHDVEQSIANLCALASHSMQQTDRQIIEIMASKAEINARFWVLCRIRRFRRIRQLVFTR